MELGLRLTGEIGEGPRGREFVADLGNVTVGRVEPGLAEGLASSRSRVFRRARACVTRSSSS